VLSGENISGLTCRTEAPTTLLGANCSPCYQYGETAVGAASGSKLLFGNYFELVGSPDLWGSPYIADASTLNLPAWRTADSGQGSERRLRSSRLTHRAGHPKAIGRYVFAIFRPFEASTAG
jgi:hypothetical protein